jgi:hypothetical protein
MEVIIKSSQDENLKEIPSDSSADWWDRLSFYYLALSGQGVTPSHAMLMTRVYDDRVKVVSRRLPPSPFLIRTLQRQKNGIEMKVVKMTKICPHKRFAHH